MSTAEIDADLLAHFAEVMKPEPRRLPDPQPLSRHDMVALAAV